MPTKQQSPVNRKSRDCGSPSGGKANKEKRKKGVSPSKESREALGKIVDAHEWIGMITLKFPKGFTYSSERSLVKKLMKQLADRLLADELTDKIGFLTKREFGKKGQLHYHIGITSKCAPTLSETDLNTTIRLHKKNYLSLIGKENNQGGYYHVRFCKGAEELSKLAAYLKKGSKYGVGVLALPSGWEPSTCARFYHTRGLSHMPRGRSQPPNTDEVLASDGKPESALAHIAPVSSATTTNWSPDMDEVQGSCSSRKSSSSTPPLSINDRAGYLDQRTTRLDDLESDGKSTLFTKENPHDQPPLRKAESTRFVENEVCQTCEYHGKIIYKRDGYERCPYCGNDWNVCHPF